jgi:thymidine phosphorylase
LDDTVDPGVGVEIVARQGTLVQERDVVLLVHHRRGRGLAEARRLLRQAVGIREAPPAEHPLIVETITHD